MSATVDGEGSAEEPPRPGDGEVDAEERARAATGCVVCGRPLDYASETLELACELCGTVAQTQIRCPSGHFVCDACHARTALDVLREVVTSHASADPSVMLELAMAHPSVAMHGPEHHAIVPAVLVAAAIEAGHDAPADALERAIERSERVPGGWCGAYGTCGAAVGVGLAVSVLTEATPLKGPERSLAMAATATTLQRMVDDQPRCCKRASRLAVEAGAELLRQRLGIPVGRGPRPRCMYSQRNAQCPGADCPYYDTSAALADDR